MFKQCRGYTLVELLLVLGIMTILLSISGLSFAAIRAEHNIDAIAAQVEAQVVRAQRATGNGTPAGVYFESTRYVYFEGTSYSEGAPDNEETLLPGAYSFSAITFTGETVQFDNVTGYLADYSDPSHVVLRQGSSERMRTISVNRWGIVQVQ